MVRSASDGGHGQRVQLLIGRRRETGELDADVPQDAAVVVVVGPATVVLERIEGLVGSRSLDVRRRPAVGEPVSYDDQAAPVPRPTLADRPLRGEDDRPFARAFRHDPRSTEDEERGAGYVVVTQDGGAGLNGEGGAIPHLDEARQGVDRVRVKGAILGDVGVDQPRGGIVIIPAGGRTDGIAVTGGEHGHGTDRHAEPDSTDELAHTSFLW